MGQALYRKHRPKSLKEVVGQEHITKTLEQALKQGRISHAYLLTGPHGVGKTSIARILAHEINGLPYTDNSTHMDIIEIDAASNRRIDEIRELREKVYVAPTSAKYKVYIIDEVHMLTREAFNALLKTLEEPPAHVVFILATTDAHKLPETIISRTQRFSFHPGEKTQMIEHLRQIAKAEAIGISDEALGLLAEHSEGSFRDSVSLLDQASSQTDTVEATDIHRLLGIPPNEAIQGLISSLSGGSEPAQLMAQLTSLYEQGYPAAAIAKQLGQSLRGQLIDGTQKDSFVLPILEQLIEVPISTQPERLLEITLLRALPSSPTTRPQPKLSPEKPLPEVPLNEPVVEAEPPREHIAANIPDKPITRSEFTTLDEITWPEVLQALKQRHNTLYGVIRMAQPDFSESGQLTLAFSFGFHQKRLKENGNQQKLADIIAAVTGQNVRIECIVDKAATPFAAAPSKKPVASDLTAISNIFGDAELLES